MKKMAILACFMAWAGVSFGDLLLGFDTGHNSGLQTSEPSSNNSANVQSATLTLTGITAAANTNRFGGTSWNTTQTINSSTDYIEWTLAANAGFMFTVTNFVFQWDRSATGPTNVALRSSLDSYASDLGLALALPAAMSTNTMAITGITDQQSVTFRLYGYGARDTGGTGGFDKSNNTSFDNVVMNGFTAVIPEPSSLALTSLAFAALMAHRRRHHRV